MKPKVTLTCALNGVLTNPKTHAVPVTPEEMAKSAREAFEAGATIVHCHYRDQGADRGHLPSWDPQVAKDIVAAIRSEVPEIIVNCTTGVIGSDLSGPFAVLESSRPEMAAMNAGSLNYLKVKSDGQWAWPPMLFDNPVEKVTAFLHKMQQLKIIPEFECFDTGILRSVKMYRQAKLFDHPPFISLVMGVASGMPANPNWLPLLVDEMDSDAHWQVIAIGRENVWPLLRRAIQLGGDVRTGLEDTFYLPTGEKTKSNGALIESLTKLVREEGYEVASPQETRQKLMAELPKQK